MKGLASSGMLGQSLFYMQRFTGLSMLWQGLLFHTLTMLAGAALYSRSVLGGARAAGPVRQPNA